MGQGTVYERVSAGNGTKERVYADEKMLLIGNSTGYRQELVGISYTRILTYQHSVGLGSGLTEL